jgi:hypothetical protein
MNTENSMHNIATPDTGFIEVDQPHHVRKPDYYVSRTAVWRSMSVAVFALIIIIVVTLIYYGRLPRAVL